MNSLKNYSSLFSEFYVNEVIPRDNKGLPVTLEVKTKYLNFYITSDNKNFSCKIDNLAQIIHTEWPNVLIEHLYCIDFSGYSEVVGVFLDSYKVSQSVMYTMTEFYDLLAEKSILTNGINVGITNTYRLDDILLQLFLENVEEPIFAESFVAQFKATPVGRNVAYALISEPHRTTRKIGVNIRKQYIHNNIYAVALRKFYNGKINLLQVETSLHKFKQLLRAGEING